MKFCPQCGNSLVVGDAFCEQCGLKIDHEVPVSPAPKVDETQQIQPDIPPLPTVEIQNLQIEEDIIQPVLSDEFVPEPKKKGTFIPILVIVGVFIILGGGGWVVFAKFIKAKPEVTVADSTSLQTTESEGSVNNATSKVNAPQTVQVPATTTAYTAKDEIPSQTENVSTNSATVSKATTPEKNTPLNNDVRTENQSQSETYSQPTAAEIAEHTSITIFQVGEQGLSILKNPMKDCAFTLKGRYCITRITTDHYNSGNGTPRTGIIGIEDMKGKIVKQLHAKGRSGSSGVENCKWFIEPGIILGPGNYRINDSGKETWTKKITEVGFVLIEGYKVQ
jgi:hypothetical protein